MRKNSGFFGEINYKNKIFFKIWHIHLYMSIFFCIFAAGFYVRMGARRYVYERKRKNISGISYISRRENGERIGAPECGGTEDYHRGL